MSTHEETMDRLCKIVLTLSIMVDKEVQRIIDSGTDEEKKFIGMMV